MFRLFEKGLGNAAAVYYNERKKEEFFMTVTVDSASCIGCSMCAYAAPGIFRMEGRVSTVLPRPDETQFERAAGAANRCPVNAIKISK